MDTTETYIKMRVKAIPDLGMGVSPKVIPYNFLTETVYVDSVGNFYCVYRQGKDDAVIGCQLERQDQLQGMVEEVRLGQHFAFRFHRFLEGHYRPITAQSPYIWFANLDDDKREKVVSMEQLWLAFVMKEKYNKVWNGEEWIKAS